MTGPGGANTTIEGLGSRRMISGRLRLERRGVDSIDEDARTSTPWTFFTIFLGGAVSLGNVLFGWIPITFGLGVWDALSSIAVGTVIGIALLVPLMIIGSRTATNNSTASGAHFGVRGRLIGSIIGLAIMITTTAIGIWTAGGAAVGVAQRLFATPITDPYLAIAYVLLTALAVVVAIYGYHLLVRATAVLTIIGGLVVVLTPVALAGRIDLGYTGGSYLLGDFWQTWILSTVTVGVGGVMSVSTIMGDWTRYISPRRYPATKLVPVTSFALLLGYLVPYTVGVLSATTFADPFAPFPQSLAAAVPSWYLVVLLPYALFGGLGFAAQTTYSGGLDLDAIVPPLSRAKATAIVSVATVGLVLVGSFVWDASASISAGQLLLLALIAPWAAIVGIGFLRCRGAYLPHDLQVFNRGQRGGAYWFTGGWNWRAVIAWLAGASFGIMTVQTSLYVGPLGDLAGGIDVSFMGSFAIAGVLYLALDTVFPASAPPPRLRRRHENPRAQQCVSV